MKKSRCALGASGGFTTIELILVVTILGILLAIIGASYDTLKAKMRFAQVRADMDGIAQAAYTDYANKDATWAQDELPGVAPSFTALQLRKWPQPPCPGWAYDWDNWSTFPMETTRVTLRRGDLLAIYSYCISNCTAPDIFGGTPPELSSLSSRYIYCNE